MARGSDPHPNAPPDRGERRGNENQAPQASATAAADFAEKYSAITVEMVEVVRKIHCPTATDVELHYFFSVCQKTGLDPLTGQIHLVKRKQKVQNTFGTSDYIEVARPLTGIDGFRVIAERTGQYRGQGPIEWCGSDGVWKDVWLSSKPPSAARATVYREGREPMVAVAHWSEYVVMFGERIAFKWEQSPAGMIGKCAEALALRKAFPNDLSGLHTEEEMAKVTETAEANGGYQAPPKPAAVVDVAAVVAQQAASTAVTSQAAAAAPPPPALESTEQKDRADADLAAFRAACEAATSKAELQKANTILNDYFAKQKAKQLAPFEQAILVEGEKIYVNADQRLKQAARAAQQPGGAR